MVLGNAFSWAQSQLGVFLWLGQAHVKVCYTGLDPVFDAPPTITPSNLRDLPKYRRSKIESSKFNNKLFIFPLLIFFTNNLDNLWVFWKDDFDYYNRPMRDFLYHKIYTESFWYQSDLIVVAIVGCSIVVYWNMFWYPWLDDRWAMYFVYDPQDNGVRKLIVNGKVWDEVNAEKIYKFRQSSRKSLKILMIMTYFFFLLYFEFHFWLKPEGGFRHYFLMFLFFPCLLFYTCFGAIDMFYHVNIALNYICIKQKHLIESMDELIDRLRKPKKRQATSFPELYSEFLRLNSLMAYQCNEIRGYNSFWSIYLTAQFACCLFCICYLAFCYLFIEAGFDQQVYYVSFSFEYAGLIFSDIYRCSIIDRNNDICYDRNMKACVLFQLHYKPTYRQLMNIHKIATNRNFTRCCFRLKNSYRLDSTAFNLAIYILTTLFLKICNKAYTEE